MVLDKLGNYENQVKFKSRKEKRKVTETMYALLVPMAQCLNAETAFAVKRTLEILSKVDVEETENDSQP